MDGEGDYIMSEFFGRKLHAGGRGHADDAEISAARLAGAVLFTVSGYVIAALINVLFPQVAEVKELTVYSLAGFSVDRNAFYRLVLAFICLLYVLSALIACFKTARRARMVSRSAFRFAGGVALGVWDIVGTKLQLLPRPFFPGPAEILEAFLNDGAFIWKNMLYSLRLFTVGFVIGVIVGVATGILIGWFPKANYWIGPILNICGVIPAVAWMPFALTLFPSAFSAAAFLIVICGWFPIASLTAQGISSTPKAQLEAARTLGGGTFYQVFHVAVPHALPQIFIGIGTANAFSFTTLVTAEMMGQPGGLGYYINAAKVWSNYYKVFASILVMAILFSLIMKFMGLIQAYALRWQKGTVKQ